MIFGRASSIRDSTGTNETVTTVNGEVALITRQRKGYILTATLTEFHRPADVNILPGGPEPGASGHRYLRLYSPALHSVLFLLTQTTHDAGRSPSSQMLPEYPSHQASPHQAPDPKSVTSRSNSKIPLKIMNHKSNKNHGNMELPNSLWQRTGGQSCRSTNTCCFRKASILWRWCLIRAHKKMFRALSLPLQNQHQKHNRNRDVNDKKLEIEIFFDVRKNYEITDFG